jgi:hypothetical protein
MTKKRLAILTLKISWFATCSFTDSTLFRGKNKKLLTCFLNLLIFSSSLQPSRNKLECFSLFSWDNKTFARKTRSLTMQWGIIGVLHSGRLQPYSNIISKPKKAMDPSLFCYSKKLTTLKKSLSCK